jgi:hypothetical protein
MNLDLTTGGGPGRALAGTEVVVNASQSSRGVLVESTARLLRAGTMVAS